MGKWQVSNGYQVSACSFYNQRMVNKDSLRMRYRSPILPFHSVMGADHSGFNLLFTTLYLNYRTEAIRKDAIDFCTFQQSALYKVNGRNSALISLFIWQQLSASLCISNKAGHGKWAHYSTQKWHKINTRGKYRIIKITDVNRSFGSRFSRLLTGSCVLTKHTRMLLHEDDCSWERWKNTTRLLPWIHTKQITLLMSGKHR